ncbi:MAG: hypothetical protein GY811_13910 [Myxococcales bacterium]|nr:hypothetical protein [Myxococcales bacterium]
MESLEISRYEGLLVELKEEFPRFRLIHKRQSGFQKLIHRALVAITFGQMKTYLSQYHTTLGQRIYVPDHWEESSEDSRYVTLCHERIHMRQFRKFTWPGMTLLYLLVPLPMGLAYFRARFEMEAYAESVRAAAEVWGPDYVRDADYRDHVLSQFMGASYGWMWPFRKRLERWYQRALGDAGAGQ